MEPVKLCKYFNLAYQIYDCSSCLAEPAVHFQVDPPLSKLISKSPLHTLLRNALHCSIKPRHRPFCESGEFECSHAPFVKQR